MLVSLHWLQRLLAAAPPGEMIERALIEAGFPIESRSPLDSGDVRLDVEITSNRGDCLSHLGLAREVAARLGLAPPIPSPGVGVRASTHAATARLKVLVPEACPRFVARVIRGVKVGPSPGWLKAAIEAAGLRSISNVVDVTNYLNLERGNPSHVFDLAKLAGGELVVRWAHEGEPLTTLDGKGRRLRGDELVVADAERAQSLAGVIGGRDSEVTPATRDVVLEVATWDPGVVRRASRQHQCRTDASHRFERLVDARTLDEASARATALVLEVAGGEASDAVGVGAAPEPTRVRLRPSRCRTLLGLELDTGEMLGLLSRLGVESRPAGRAGEDVVCEVPAWRPDLTREVDLIEEVARVKGLDAIPMPPTLPVTVRPAQASEAGRREIGATLAGLGFFETVTFSFTTPARAAMFCPRGLGVIAIDDARRGEEPALRPSVLAGLLACRRQNQHALVSVPGGVRLFETAAVFAGGEGSGSRVPGVIEHLNLGLLLDAPRQGKAASDDELQRGLSLLRGAIEAVVQVGAGEGALTVEPAEPHAPGLRGEGYARLLLRGVPLGYFGILSPESQRHYDLEGACVAGEVNLSMLLEAYPPSRGVTALPAFPGIERDLSLIVGEDVTWARIEREARARLSPPGVGVTFVGTYRGTPIPAGKKSVTLRLAYRDAGRTLRHDEIDAPVAALAGALKEALGAEIRA